MAFNGDIESDDSSSLNYLCDEDFGMSTTIGRNFNSEVRPLINVVDQLRAIGINDDIDLPTIAVVGDQSSGKSSVLEAISGVPLPRGAEIVTRCPLEMRMEKSSSPWRGEMSFTPPNKSVATVWDVKSPQDVSKLIDQATDILAGPGKNVSDHLISLRIRSPEAPDLTLIDLPGIVHSTEGHQSRDVIACVNRLLTKYMKQENTIILCVYPANMEVANCAVFNMAHEHDSNGKRTMAIITKPDLVAEKDQKFRLVKKMTEGTVYNVRNFYMVKARSPEELRQGISRDELLRREADFFEQDDVYRRVDPATRGFPSLMCALTFRLVKAIKESLPGLRGSLSSLLRQTQDELNSLPPAMPPTDAGRIAYLNARFHKFVTDVTSALDDGEKPCLWERKTDIPVGGLKSFIPSGSATTQDSKNTESTMFAVWRRSFDGFMDELGLHTRAKFAFKGAWEKDKLLDFLQRQRGEELPSFPNFTSYKKLVSEHLVHYKLFADDCVREIHEDLLAFIRYYTRLHFNDHPVLCEEVMEVAMSTAQERLSKTEEQIKFFFRMEELCYCQDTTMLRLTKQEEELEAAKKALTDRATPGIPAPLTKIIETLGEASQDRSQIAKQMQENLRIYFMAANQRLGDNIPTAIRVSLHHEFATTLTARLFESLMHPEMAMQKALEHEDVHQENRNHLTKKLQRLEEAQKLLRDFTLSTQKGIH